MVRKNWQRKPMKIPSLTALALMLTGICPPARAPASPGPDKPPGPAGGPVLPLKARVQLQRLAAAVNLARVEWSEADSGEDWSGVYSGPARFAVRFDWGKFRVRVASTYAKGYGPGLKGGKSVGEVSFDGRFLYLGDPDYGVRTQPAVLMKHDPWSETDPERLKQRIYLDYLELAGFHAPECPADLAFRPLFSSLALYFSDAGDLTKAEAQGEDLRLTFQVPDPILLRARAANLSRERDRLSRLRNGPKYATKQMQDLKKMRTMLPERVVSLFLDPKRGYAVIEREDSTPGGKLIFRARSDHWRFYSKGGIWLPGRIVQEFYANRWELRDFSDHARLTAVYRLLNAEFGRNEHTQFNLLAEYKKPATAVCDYTAPGANTAYDGYISYYVDADGKLTRRSVFQILAEVHDWSGLSRTVAIILAVLALPLMVFALMRSIRWRKGRRA
jgi:hypothetical protein